MKADCGIVFPVARKNWRYTLGKNIYFLYQLIYNANRLPTEPQKRLLNCPEHNWEFCYHINGLPLSFRSYGAFQKTIQPYCNLHKSALFIYLHL